MSLTETVLEGTIQADGTLVLDEKPNLSPGRVQVVLRQEANIVLPNDDPFWQRMRAMWAIPQGFADAGDGGANTFAEISTTREEWDDHQLAIERLQDESSSTRQAVEEPKL